ncbi:MAG: restriction endonuclease subunit S [Hydrogenophaga sp.]|nr:restriction endonuclease subunit S [Hydrogenophaga sp.]
MSSEWLTTTLGHVCDAQGGAIQTGPFGSQLHTSDYKDTGVPVVMPTNIGDGGIVEDGIARIAQTDVDRLRQHKLQLEDIVFSRRGDVTKNALIRPHEDGWFCGTGCLKVRLGDQSIANAKFISHCLRLPETKDWLVRHAVGATMPNLNTSILSAVPIALPPMAVQLEIASMLGALDDRITLLRETNATLEAIAQTLFKSWFVDFDPVLAKSEGRAPEGMDEATAALFPDSFEESALGLVPMGWTATTIRDVVEGVYDGPHATPAEADVGPVFLGIKNLTGTALDLGEVRHIAEADWTQWTRRVTPRAGDIVFSYEATLGFFALIPDGLRCCLGRRLALIRPKAIQGASHFWLHQFTAAPFQQLLDKHTIQGATVNRLALKAFPALPVLCPPLTLQLAFDQLVASLWKKIHGNQSTTLTLTTLRDTLLPRLISGKVHLTAKEEIYT